MQSLENRGVTFGVHDFNPSRGREDYHRLKISSAGDTRTRLFGVDAREGTFNATTRAASYGSRGHDPKGEYVLPKRGTLELLTAEATWPQSVTGGCVIPFQGHARSQSLHPTDRTRRAGSLGRNIVGNCTVKDERFFYFGAHGSHYGNNSGCRSTMQYKQERP
ncbi:unnamed protein product [Effrenium voratum]|uniref:Uncharacterized protein n=1 Tax=Effrenium voratum TaxID=2562239 RepID=A0AA36IYY4_9DINO|nr:unnamed protein product [Effrenium voratum]CAJ1396557.1 unnamed protein product [Effrenium voratum]CAJ1412741.1 unnamed protein product [Effrenium voratum]|mmetsp:Transcript_131200/g.311168  ORF Transcript_131200/g.311168 Transcript_131200/m.311168 type:complete len:163 (+) Transcript_131200:35-523(+)